MRPWSPTIGSFLLCVLLWLPGCLAAWYFVALPHSHFVGSISGMLLNLLHSDLVSSVELSGQSLELVTKLKVYPAPGEVAVLVPEVNPLLYTYGLAFYLALMLASRSRWTALLPGAVLLLPFQSWGVVFDFLVQVGIKLGPDVAAQAGVVPWHRELIAIGYQVGSLLLPTLAPVALWAAFNRPFIQRLMQHD